MVLNDISVTGSTTFVSPSRIIKTDASIPGGGALLPDNSCSINVNNMQLFKCSMDQASEATTKGTQTRSELRRNKKKHPTNVPRGIVDRPRKARTML